MGTHQSNLSSGEARASDGDSSQTEDALVLLSTLERSAPAVITTDCLGQILSVNMVGLTVTSLGKTEHIFLTPGMSVLCACLLL